MADRKADIKMVAVDIDGTFVRSDYTYDEKRFKRILAKMEQEGCEFVVASGNQYYQLRDLFPGYDHKLSFVAENGALVKDHNTLVYAASIPKSTVDKVTDVLNEDPEIKNVLCGLNSAYCQKGSVDQDFYDLTSIYYHRLQWTDDFKQVEDQILKFAPTVPEEQTWDYYKRFKERLGGLMEPTTSGHGSIDLIVPGCHKASGLKRLCRRWNIRPEQCVAFGDGGNDIEMLQYCGMSYAMANAPEEVKAAAARICPSNDDDGVLVALEELFGLEPLKADSEKTNSQTKNCGGREAG